jgi:hypothetical protein
MAESAIRSIARPLHTSFPWLPKDPGEAVERINRLNSHGYHSLPKETRGKASEAVENTIRYLLDKQQRTGITDPGLRSFYAAKGVPFDTLARFEAGELPMDQASRAARADQMGLDPTMVWTRNDWVGLDRPRKDYRGNLVYAGFTPQLADAAAVSRGQKYPLIGPREIIGMHRVDPAILDNPILDEDFARAYIGDSSHKPWENFRSVQEWLDSSSSREVREAAQRARSLQQSFSNLNQLATESPAAKVILKSRAADAFAKDPKSTLPAWDWPGTDYTQAAPHWKLFETTPEPGNDLLTLKQGRASQMAHDRAKEAGAKGSLVKDEGSISVAFFNPGDLRHADLSLLDPVHKGQPGYMRSLAPFLLAPAAGAAASQEQR